MRHRSFVKPLGNVYNKILRNEKLVRVFVPLVKSMALELGDGCLMVVFFCYFVKKGNFWRPSSRWSFSLEVFACISRQLEINSLKIQRSLKYMFYKNVNITLSVISYMHLKHVQNVALINKKKENIMIKINIHMQHICLTELAIWRTYRTNYVTFPINTFNLKVKVPFSLKDFTSRPYHLQGSYHIVCIKLKKI